jgi:hypothetical protein
MNQSGTRLKKMMDHDAMTFGGHRPPNLDTKYEVTVKDKLFYHAITVQVSRPLNIFFFVAGGTCKIS